MSKNLMAPRVKSILNPTWQFKEKVKAGFH